MVDITIDIVVVAVPTFRVVRKCFFHNFDEFLVVKTYICKDCLDIINKTCGVQKLVTLQ